MEGRKEREGFLLLLHDFILCDYYRPEHLLFLYVGIPAPGEVYPSGAGAVYVFGGAWREKNMRTVLFCGRTAGRRNGGKGRCAVWEAILPGNNGLCHAGIRIQSVCPLPSLLYAGGEYVFHVRKDVIAVERYQTRSVGARQVLAFLVVMI